MRQIKEFSFTTGVNLKFGLKSYPKGLKYISGRALGRLDLSFLFYHTFLPFKKYKFFSEGFGDLGKVKDLKSLLVTYAENAGKNESDYPLRPFWKEREYLGRFEDSQD